MRICERVKACLPSKGQRPEHARRRFKTAKRNLSSAAAGLRTLLIWKKLFSGRPCLLVTNQKDQEADSFTYMNYGSVIDSDTPPTRDVYHGFPNWAQQLETDQLATDGFARPDSPQSDPRQELREELWPTCASPPYLWESAVPIAPRAVPFNPSGCIGTEVEAYSWQELRPLSKLTTRCTPTFLGT